MHRYTLIDLLELLLLLDLNPSLRNNKFSLQPTYFLIVLISFVNFLLYLTLV